MADGIDNSSVVCVFITSRYIQKASGKGETGADDNCKFEVTLHQKSFNLKLSGSEVYYTAHALLAMVKNRVVNFIAKMF